MKSRELLLLTLFLPTIIYSKNLNYNLENENATIYTIEKGKGYIRDGIFQKMQGKDGRSGSNQHIEYINGKTDFDSREKYNGYTGDVEGVVLGTTSTFRKTEESTWITGVTFSYLNSEIDYDDSTKNDKTDVFNYDGYIAYERLGYVFMGYGGLSKGDGDHSGDKDSVVLGGEIGKVQPLGVGLLYPYLSLTGMRTFGDDSSYDGVKYKDNNETYTYYRIGSEYRVDFDKYFTKIYVEYVGVHTNSDNKIRLEDSGVEEREELFALETDSIRYGGVLGYNLDETLTLALELTQIQSNTDDMLIGGVRISHKF